MTDLDSRQDAWERAYGRRQNFVFYPDEELVRFVSRHLRKRTGFDSFEDVHPNASGLRLLDAGCGIGRHMAMALDFGFDSYGYDLSENAIAVARSWLKMRGIDQPGDRAVQADARDLPWQSGFFDAAISHAVLDSMPFAIAQAAVSEIRRVLKPRALFFCDVIGGGDHEEVIRTDHERDTLQSFYTDEKADRLFAGSFAVVERVRRDRTNLDSGHVHTRLHFALQRID